MIFKILIARAWNNSKYHYVHLVLANRDWLSNNLLFFPPLRIKVGFLSRPQVQKLVSSPPTPSVPHSSQSCAGKQILQFAVTWRHTNLDLPWDPDHRLVLHFLRPPLHPVILEHQGLLAPLYLLDLPCRLYFLVRQQCLGLQPDLHFPWPLEVP